MFPRAHTAWNTTYTLNSSSTVNPTVSSTNGWTDAEFYNTVERKFHHAEDVNTVLWIRIKTKTLFQFHSWEDDRDSMYCCSYTSSATHSRGSQSVRLGPEVGHDDMTSGAQRRSWRSNKETRGWQSRLHQNNISMKKKNRNTLYFSFVVLVSHLLLNILILGVQ